MNSSHNLIAGLTIVISNLTVIFIFLGIKGLTFLATLCFWGWLGIKLYEIKSNSWWFFLLVKVPLNIFFNPFLFVLLLKSWTMLSYKYELEKLDLGIIAANKYLNT